MPAHAQLNLVAWRFDSVDKFESQNFYAEIFAKIRLADAWDEKSIMPTAPA
jgi:hypothetical protein